MTMQLSLYFLLVSFVYPSNAQPPQTNVVEVPISDTTSIVRSGSGWVDNVWVPTSNPSNICGSWTRNVGDSVTFKFTGTSISVVGDIVYPGLTQALLDGKPLTPHPEVENVICNEILFSADNLDPTEHTIVVTASGGARLRPVLAIQKMRYTASTASSSISASSTLSGSSSGVSAASTLNSQTATLTDLDLLNSDSLTATANSQAANPQATNVQATSSQATNSQSASRVSGQSGSITSPSKTSGTDGASSASFTDGSSGGSKAQVRVGTSNRTGAIAGGVTGGIAGLLLVILAILQAHEALYYLSSLGFSLFGWLLFKGRIFVLIPERKIGAVDITLFLSNHENITDTPMDGSEVLLVWQVAKVGYSRRSFSVCCPCVNGTGNTMLGFGVVDDKGHAVRSETAAPAPTTWNGYELEEIKTEEGKQASSVSPDFTNDPEAPIEAVTLGTHEETKNHPIFRPFLWIRRVPVGQTYTADNKLYVHAFITHGYEDGQYGEKLVGDIRNDMLTERGVKVTDLKPRSNWYISKTATGKLKLKVKGYMNEKDDEDDEEKALLRT